MIRFIIIDDEPLAHETIEEYSAHLPYMRLIKNCYNAFEAIECLNTLKIDLILLDIQMPGITGFEFLKAISNPPDIIVTTAFKEYAIEGYELNIVDYLLKPFSLQRFVKAVQRVNESNFERKVNHTEPKTAKDAVFLKDGSKNHQVLISDILFIEALGNYTKVITTAKTITTLEKLSSYLDILPKEEFVQVHKSYIVAVSRIEIIQHNAIFISDFKLPIGQTFKLNVQQLLKRE